MRTSSLDYHSHICQSVLCSSSMFYKKWCEGHNIWSLSMCIDVSSCPPFWVLLLHGDHVSVVDSLSQHACWSTAWLLCSCWRWFSSSGDLRFYTCSSACVLMWTMDLCAGVWCYLGISTWLCVSTGVTAKPSLCILPVSVRSSYVHYRWIHSCPFTRRGLWRECFIIVNHKLATNWCIFHLSWYHLKLHACRHNRCMQRRWWYQWCLTCLPTKQNNRRK